MANNITFAGKTIPGSWRTPQAPPPDLELIISKFPGLAGEFALNGRTGGRDISIPGLLFAPQFTSGSSVRAFINLLNDPDHIGLNGSLVLPFGNSVRGYHDCTFRGFEELPPGPIQDVGGNLNKGDRNCWCCPGVLYFRQHTVNDN